MARRKKITISYEEFEFYKIMLYELGNHPEYSQIDLSTIVITGLEKIIPKIKDISKVIANLKRYAEVNKELIPVFGEGYDAEQLIDKSLLSKMLGIERPTLDDWIKKGFITPSKSKLIRNTETYPVASVLKQLEEQAKKQESEK